MPQTILCSKSYQTLFGARQKLKHGGQASGASVAIVLKVLNARFMGSNGFVLI
jgi:hypothetical protein